MFTRWAYTKFWNRVTTYITNGFLNHNNLVVTIRAPTGSHLSTTTAFRGKYPINYLPQSFIYRKGCALLKASRVHDDTPQDYLNIFPRDECINFNAAGVKRTIIRLGKINNPIGISILIGALWASSSACCRRLIRI
jgi:hypothetical protein